MKSQRFFMENVVPAGCDDATDAFPHLEWETQIVVMRIIAQLLEEQRAGAVRPRHSILRIFQSMTSQEIQEAINKYDMPEEKKVVVAEETWPRRRSWFIEEKKVVVGEEIATA